MDGGNLATKSQLENLHYDAGGGGRSMKVNTQNSLKKTKQQKDKLYGRDMRDRQGDGETDGGRHY